MNALRVERAVGSRPRSFGPSSYLISPHLFWTNYFYLNPGPNQALVKSGLILDNFFDVSVSVKVPLTQSELQQHRRGDSLDQGEQPDGGTSSCFAAKNALFPQKTESHQTLHI